MNLLEGIKIIDFTRLLPGPMATHILAQMGAEVIKVESPKRLDYVRSTGGPMVDGASQLYHLMNHNKTEKLVDYNTPEGKNEVLELIKTADVLIEQFRPGAMDAWGFAYEAIKEINPSIVYLSLTGYKNDGAYKNEAGHDFNYLAYAGIMSLIKDDAGKPILPDTQLADISGAYMAINALQAGLIKQLKRGEGSYINVSLADAVNPFLAIPYAIYKSDMDYRKFNILDGKTTVNYAAYQCADLKWISLAALEMKFWNNFCEIVEKPNWKTQNPLDLFLTNFDKTEIEQLFKTKTRAEWTSLLQGKDCCYAPILEVDELENSHYHQNNKTFENFESPNGHPLRTFALPFQVK